jgi:NAD(P)-dependent dehydrogenase (short-subunit alcohol dehydrogenase family)
VKGFTGQAAYVATKHDLIELARSAALDSAAQGIRINARSCPGIIDTEMTRRFTGDTDEGKRDRDADGAERDCDRTPADPTV